MKKRLANPSLTNELREGSVFFRRPAQSLIKKDISG